MKPYRCIVTTSVEMNLRAGLAVAIAIGMIAGHACAQSYPTKPVRILVGFPPGGPVDSVARVVAQRLPAYLGQPVVVENRPGADASIAMEALAKAPPDGHTLYLLQPGVAINPALYKSVPFDPVKDFAPISLIGESPNLVVVHPGLSSKTLQEFVAFAKERPGQLNYGATSSPTHLAHELFNAMAGVAITRVPFKGAAPAFAAVMAGDVQVVMSSIGTLLPLARSGKVRALAVTSARRSALAPDIPTVSEAGVSGYVATTWYGLAAPGQTPRGIIDRVNADLRKVLAEQEVKSQLLNLGIDEPSPSTPEQLSELVRSELAKWAKVVKDSGAKID
ncbi:MAG: Bug family tripartite tricarboxylate transporter substrate binding protein [Burkholderiales bacterium]